MAGTTPEGMVPALSPEGVPIYVPKDKVAENASAGGRVISEKTAEQIREQAAFEAKHNPIDHPLQGAEDLIVGGNLARLSGVTGGLSDVAIAKLGGDRARAYLNEQRRASPLLSGVEEATGFASAAMAVPGEGSAASALGRVAQGAARGGAEMALYSAGKEAASQALAGEDLNAQKIIASGLHGGVIGMATGGALSGLGELGTGLRARAAAATEEAAGAAAPKGSLREILGKKAQEASDEHFFKALGGTQGMVEKAERQVEGGASKVAADVKSVLREELGVKSLPSDRHELQDAIEKGLDRLTEKRAGMLAKLDGAGAGIAPSPASAVQKIQAELIAPNMVARTVEVDGKAVTQMVPKFGREAQVKAAQEMVERLESGFGDKAPTFAEWAKAITDIGKEGRWDARVTPAAAEVKQQVYGILSKELDAAGDQAAAQMGESFSAGYRANQGVLQSLLKAKEMVERGVARTTQNNAVGLTSRMAGMAGAAVGTMVGGLPGTVIGGAVSTGLGKLVQDRGSMLASDLLEQAAGVLGVRNVAARAEAQMAKGVSGLVGKAANDNAAGLAPPRAALSRPSGTPRAQFDKIQSQLSQVVANPERTADAIGRSTQGLSGVSPALTNAIVATVLRGASYLQTKLPPSHQDPYSIQPQFQKPRVSDADVSKFLRSYDAVNHPLGVLDEARKGTLTREHVEALKAVYPDLYETMRSQVMESLITSKSELPYSRRIQLGILLDIPTDKTLSPDFLKAIQATYTSGEQAGAESPPPQNAPQLNISEPAMTTTESVTANLR